MYGLRLSGDDPGMAPKVRSRLKQRRPLFIKQWRVYRGLNQDELAELADVSQGLISLLERNDTDYSGETLAKLAFALKCHVADLLTRGPTDPDGPWELYDTLSPVQKRQAVDRVFSEWLNDIRRTAQAVS